MNSIAAAMSRTGLFDRTERFGIFACVGIPVVEEGVFKGYHGTTMDVTEQELLTQELRREQAYLAEAQSLTHTGSWAMQFRHTQDIPFIRRKHSPVWLRPQPRPDISSTVFYTQFMRKTHRRRMQLLRMQSARERITTFPNTGFVLTDGSIRILRAIGHHNPSGDLASTSASRWT